MLLIPNPDATIICPMDNMRIGHLAWNATRVWERLWVGGLPDAEELAKQNPHRISTVISLSQFPVESKRNNVAYVHLPIEDGQPLSVGNFDRIMDAIAESIRWGVVLINCGAGVSRAPTMTASWMHCVGYRNIDSALVEIKKLRPFINPSRSLVNSIRRHLA
jgi:protein-tyrosine phosphatase